MANDDFKDYYDPFEPQPPQRERPYYRPRDFRAAARKALKGFWLMAIVVTFVAALLGGIYQTGPSVNVNVQLDEQTLQQLDDIPGVDISLLEQPTIYDRFPFLRTLSPLLGVLAAVQLLIGGTIELGYNRFKLRRLDGEEAKFGDLFSAFDQFIEALWMRIRIFLQVLLWALLFIIPGIVAAYRYAMVPYLMAEYPEMTVSQAFERSKAMMNGHKADLFLLHLSFIGWFLIGALTMGIGLLWILPYQQMAEAAFYRNLSAGGN